METNMQELSSALAIPFKISMGQKVYFIIKRILDTIVGIVGSILLIPMAFIVKISYMLHGDFSSVFFTQDRVGKHGKIIKLYKFRTMIPNAEEVLKEMLKEEKWKKEWEKNQKFDKDPRITAIGKFLRKLSLDEFPQFLNVLKGDMSLIGPRPLVPGELDAHQGDHKVYESVRPGITGWWACNGRNATTYDDRLALEYYYIYKVSLILDIKCVFKTITAVLSRRGAK